MKRQLLFLLATVICLTTVSCAGNKNSINSEEPIPISEESSAPVVRSCIQKDEIDKILSQQIDRTKPKKNVLAGKKYSFTAACDNEGGYQDSEGAKLTDGKTAEMFDYTHWVGWANKSLVSVDFDLGSNHEPIGEVTVSSLRHLEYGVGLPATVEILASEDGKNYTVIGSIGTPADLTKIQKYTYTFGLAKGFTACYLKVSFKSPESGWLFCDEISAYSYAVGEQQQKETEVSGYYGDSAISPVTEPLYWDKNDSDYNKYQNLALGLKNYIIEQFSSFPQNVANEKYNALPANGKLTDGEYGGNATFDDFKMFGFSGGDGRNVVFDLGKISAVKEIRGEVLSQKVWGVYPPLEYGVSVSENGVDWQAIDTVFIEDNDEATKFITFRQVFKETYKARFVKLSFLVSRFAFFSEIEIYGTKSIPKNAKTVNSSVTPATKIKNKYPDKDFFGSYDDIICTPVCRKSNNGYDEDWMITKEEFLPYVGYYDETGKLSDTFMDAFIFSPANGYTDENLMGTKDGWEFYINSVFTKDRNLSALDQATKDVAGSLGRKNYKSGVFLSILRPADMSSSANYGDFDGDGVSDLFNTLENKKKAVKWQIDTQLEKYKSGGYKNLQLLGFYWQEEFISRTEPYEKEMIRYVSDYVHSLGYKLLWVPYYQAYLFESWQEYGIDLASLQPNYTFTTIPDEDRLRSSSMQSKMYGMAVEIEISDYYNRENIRKYHKYLSEGVKYGYDDTVKVYYQGGIPGDLSKAMNSEDAYIRSAYHDTYKFAKGLLDESYSPEPKGIIVNPSEKTFNGKLNKSIKEKLTVETSDYYRIEMTMSPLYGKIQINNDGTFVYTPIQNFNGADSFEVVAVFDFGRSESVKIYLDVG